MKQFKVFSVQCSVFSVLLLLAVLFLPSVQAQNDLPAAPVGVDVPGLGTMPAPSATLSTGTRSFFDVAERLTIPVCYTFALNGERGVGPAFHYQLVYMDTARGTRYSFGPYATVNFTLDNGDSIRTYAGLGVSTRVVDAVKWGEWKSNIPILKTLPVQAVSAFAGFGVQTDGSRDFDDRAAFSVGLHFTF